MKKTRSSRQASNGSEQLTILPKPHFNPTYPNPNTLLAKCLSLMLNGKHLTHPEFEKETGSWRLAAVIFDLKDLGWPIESYERPAPTLDAPARHISHYFLPPRIIEAVSGGVTYDD